MAFTFTPAISTVFGNTRTLIGEIAVGTQTSGAFATGLRTVYGMNITIKSADTSTSVKWKINTASGSTAVNGYVFGDESISGDVFYATIYGR